MDEDYIAQTRLDKMEKMIADLERLRDKYARINGKCNKALAITNGVSIAMATIATATGSTVLATGMLPFGVITLVCSTVCGVSSGFNKFATKKSKKYSKLHEVTGKCLNELNILLSNSIDDGHISQKEYKDFVEKYNGCHQFT